MPIVPDMQNPITDEFASQLYGRATAQEVARLVGQEGLEWRPWHQTTPDVRDVYRALAKRFLAGDLSVLPWTYPPGMVG